MSLRDAASIPNGYSVAEPPPHSLHECRSPEEFCGPFESLVDRPVSRVSDDVVDPAAPKAVFLVGSLPLGMATSASDIDFIVLVDDRNVLLGRERGYIANNQLQIAFCNDGDPLIAGNFMTLMNEISVDVTVVITPSIRQIQNRLRRRGPELSENEIMALSRLATGWLLWQSEGYLERNGVVLSDPALDVYCATRNFTLALLYRRKGMKALALADIPLALHLGRLSIEMAYLAYFASEGLAYVGPKWLAQIGHARGAAERVNRHPLLARHAHLLFPAFPSSPEQAARYLEAVTELLASMRALIEQKMLFRIAFKACPQIYPV
jgi:hypothetical protein